MASRWIVKRNGKEQGPFTSPQLKSLADSGQLRRKDLVRKHDSERFVPAEEVKRLFDAPSDVSSNQQRSPTDPPAILVAELVEVIEDDPPEVVEYEYEEEADLDQDDEAKGDADDYADYEASAARPRRSANRRPERGNHRRSRSTRTTPSKPRKPKTSGEEEDGPWQELFGGLVAIGIGVFLFIIIGPNGVEIRGWGIIVWVMMILNYIGGRWAILVFFILAGIACLWDAFKKFTDR